MILAIDAGFTDSGWCVIGDDYKPLLFGKTANEDVLPLITSKVKTVVLERVASYGMPVGKEVFETCEWVGRFAERADENGIPVEYIYRREEKLEICHDSKAKDANIRQALIDMFAQHDFKNGKGTKENPDWFYGFKADMWTAYAVGVTFKMKQDELKRKN